MKYFRNIPALLFLILCGCASTAKQEKFSPHPSGSILLITAESMNAHLRDFEKDNAKMGGNVIRFSESLKSNFENVGMPVFLNHYHFVSEKDIAFAIASRENPSYIGQIFWSMDKEYHSYMSISFMKIFYDGKSYKMGTIDFGKKYVCCSSDFNATEKIAGNFFYYLQSNVFTINGQPDTN